MAESCRICLRRSDITIPMMRKQNGISPLEKLMKCKIKTNIYNSKRSLICIKCNSELDVVVSFVLKCEKSYKLLLLNANPLNGTRSVNTTDPLVNDCDLDVHTAKDACDDFDNIQAYRAPSSENASTSKDKEARFTQYTCLQCGKIFNKKLDYILHMKRHNMRLDPNRHHKSRSQCACPVPGCGKTFSTTTNLNTHISSHTGEKPYECMECGKRFISKNTLRNHLKIHTGIKPYLCPVCGARFTTNKMSEHMRTHTDDKPYSCDVPGCNKNFKSKLALNKHASTTHRSDAVYCSLCPSKYKHSQSLRKHLRKKHGYKIQDNEINKT